MQTNKKKKSYCQKYSKSKKIRDNPSQNILAVVDKISKINTSPPSPPVSMFKNVSRVGFEH